MSVQLESVPKGLGWKDIELRKSPSPDILAPSDDKFLLANAPPTLRYIPEFITEEEERQLIAKIQTVPDSKWIDDGKDQRRLNFGQVPQEDGTVELFDPEFPGWTDQMIARVMEVQRGFSSVGRPEFFRINEYQPGMGFRPHLDQQTSGPLNAVVTLGSSCLLDFYYKPPKGVLWEEENLRDLHIGSVWMEPRSLLFLSDEIFTSMLHGIKAVKEDVITDKVFNRPEYLPIGSVIPRALRYSLTNRYVIFSLHSGMQSRMK